MAPPPLTWAEADRQWLVAQGATNVEGLVLAGSSRSSTGFEGVYASGGGFRAELQSSGHVSHQFGTIPAQANLQTGAMVMAQLPPHALRTWDPNALQAKFHALVMCNFTPRNPNELPPSRWVSYNTLFRLFEPHAPVEVWQVGPGNLKQLITKWFQGHPTFVGLETSVWCKRVTKQARCTYQFSFEHTPQ